jgi:hypothetical protein
MTMRRTAASLGSNFSTLYPPPPRVHWAVLLVTVAIAEVLVYLLAPHFIRDFLINLVAAAWPIYLCIWIRKIDRKSISLYWALASFITGFLFSWILWIVVIFEVREELLAHYNRREPVGLQLNWFLTLLFSFAYFQYNLRAIAFEKEGETEELPEEAERFIIP